MTPHLVGGLSASELAITLVVLLVPIAVLVGAVWLIRIRVQQLRGERPDSMYGDRGERQ